VILHYGAFANPKPNVDVMESRQDEILQAVRIDLDHPLVVGAAVVAVESRP